MYCKRCYYSLRQLVKPSCPECGTPFNWDDPESYLEERPLSAREEARELMRRIAELATVTGGLWLAAFVLVLLLELCHAGPILTKFRGDASLAPLHDRVVSAIYVGLMILPCLPPLSMIVLTAWVWPKLADPQQSAGPD